LLFFVSNLCGSSSVLKINVLIITIRVICVLLVLVPLFHQKKNPTNLNSYPYF
jgi:hypothetical protein